MKRPPAKFCRNPNKLGLKPDQEPQRKAKDDAKMNHSLNPGDRWDFYLIHVPKFMDKHRAAQRSGLKFK